jgi:hypothetical protein
VNERAPELERVREARGRLDGERALHDLLDGVRTRHVADAQAGA